MIVSYLIWLSNEVVKSLLPEMGLYLAEVTVRGNVLIFCTKALGVPVVLMLRISHIPTDLQE